MRAGVAELVDARVSNTRSFGSIGSTPITRTTRNWIQNPKRDRCRHARSFKSFKYFNYIFDLKSPASFFYKTNTVAVRQNRDENDTSNGH